VNLICAPHDSGNPYASGSGRDLGRKAPRSLVDSKSKYPGSLWAHGNVVTPRKKDPGSNLAPGIASLLRHITDRIIIIIIIIGS
jgi:hypothetical protein